MRRGALFVWQIGRHTVLADNQTVRKAWVLVMLGPVRTRDPEELQALFDRF